MNKDFISIHDITRYEFQEILDLGRDVKENPDKYAASHYENVYILKELITRVIAKKENPMDGSKLEAAIWDNPTFKSVYGMPVLLKKDGTSAKLPYIYKITGGKPVIVKKPE